MENWFKTIHCQSRQHCEMCRNDKNFRIQLLNNFEGLDNIDFNCPFDLKNEIKPKPKIKKIKKRKRGCSGCNKSKNKIKISIRRK